MHLGWLSFSVIEAAASAFFTAEVGLENMTPKCFIMLISAVIGSTFVFPDEDG